MLSQTCLVTCYVKCWKQENEREKSLRIKRRGKKVSSLFSSTICFRAESFIFRDDLLGNGKKHQKRSTTRSWKRIFVKLNSHLLHTAAKRRARRKFFAIDQITWKEKKFFTANDLAWYLSIFRPFFLGVYTSICLGPDSLQHTLYLEKVGLGFFENISIDNFGIKTWF